VGDGRLREQVERLVVPDRERGVGLGVEDAVETELAEALARRRPVVLADREVPGGDLRALSRGVGG
jgi:hypothetical protein